MAKTRTQAASGPAASRHGSVTWLLGMICGAVLAFATPTALLAGFLLAPAILVAVCDRVPGRATTRCVFIASTGLAFGPVWHLNAGGATLGMAFDMLLEPNVLCPAWLAGASAWAVCECLPVLLRGASDRLAAAQAAALLEEARALRARWDVEPGQP
jgi:hypothetical protein